MPDFYQVEQPQLPEARKQEGHKGDYGHVLVVAGSRGMTGAAILCTVAASRVGGGLVTIAAPEGIIPAFPVSYPPAMAIPLKETPQGTIALGALRQIQEGLKRANVLAIGPGLGRNASTDFLVHKLIETSTIPIVLDADGLTAIAGKAEILKLAKVPIIITPHPGEMARLVGKTVQEVQNDRRGTAHGFSLRNNVTVVLKGAATVVAGGGQIFINSTGTPYMASGGAGDVLTGMIAGLLAQRMDPFNAARTGVYWHGLAADRAPSAAGPGAVTAVDILEQLKRSGTDIDWYNEELRIEEEEVFDPDTAEDRQKEINW